LCGYCVTIVFTWDFKVKVCGVCWGRSHCWKIERKRGKDNKRIWRVKYDEFGSSHFENLNKYLILPHSFYMRNEKWWFN
jgi:hypothetical protein